VKEKINSLRGAFYGWRILGASIATNGFGGSVHRQGFTVLFLPVAESLGLTRAQTSLAFSLSRAENGIMGPFTGWLIDRFGVRPLMLIGTSMVGVGYIILARTDTYREFVFVYIFVITLGASTSFMQATTTALNKWFIRRRGMVMSLNSAAARLGGAGMVPLLSYIILRWDWQTAATLIGIMMLVVVAPLALVMRRSPEEYGLHPDGDDHAPRSKSSATQTRSAKTESPAFDGEEDDWGVREAIGTRAFYVLALGTVLRMSVHGAMFVHIIPVLVWKGQSPQAAAWMVGGIALVSVPLIIVLGWLSDKIGRQRILAALYISAGSSLLLLNYVEGTFLVFMALLLFVGSEAGSALNWALVGDLFGRKKFATIRGLLAPMYNGALFVTPVAAGWVFDETQSYQWVMITGAALYFLSSIAFLNLRAPARANANIPVKS
jgi:MFS family permease